MGRFGTAFLLSFVVGAAVVSAQAPKPAACEVASIKPNVGGINFTRVRFQPNGEFVATNATLRALIVEAYQVRDFQLADAPSWAGSTRFDVVAKVGADTRSDDWRAMLRTLLQERFTLAVRRETREESVYAMTIADPGGALGPHVKKTTLACSGAAKPFLQPGQSNPCGLTAVREQLGLRLQPARGPVAFLIVDSVRELVPD